MCVCVCVCVRVCVCCVCVGVLVCVGVGVGVESEPIFIRCSMYSNSCFHAQLINLIWDIDIEII